MGSKHWVGECKNRYEKTGVCGRPEDCERTVDVVLKCLLSAAFSERLLARLCNILCILALMYQQNSLLPFHFLFQFKYNSTGHGLEWLYNTACILYICRVKLSPPPPPTGRGGL
jgi:hypothetical protein